MNNGNDDRPLARWTTANLLGAAGFVAMVFTAWVDLKSDVTELRANDRNKEATISEIKRDVRASNDKLDRLLLANGLPTHGGEK